MDDFKPLLPFEDSTIALHIVTLLKTIGADPILMVTGHRAEELEEYLSHTGIRFLRNEAYRETQMFDSVRMGIEAIADECDKIMLMPIDTPAIMLETFHQVMMIDADMVRTVYGGRPGHPILLRSEVAKKLCAYTGDRGLRGAMEESGIPITSLEVDDRGVNWDVDTQEEYRRLIEWNHERGEGYPIRPVVQLRLVAAETFFGPGSAELLSYIEQTGSIQNACEAMGLSYSKGSRMIKTAEKNLGFKLLERWTGGSGGGGSRITAEGRRLLKCYQNMLERVENCTGDIFRECFSKGFRE
jgi:molybdate transport repressor ModE-like protein